MSNYTRKETNEYGFTYYYNGKGQLHRLDGPAIEYRDGYKAWYVDGKRLSYYEFQSLIINKIILDLLSD